MITQENIKVTAYKSDGFIGKYQKLIRDTVIPYQYSVLCDEAPDTEKSHVVKNFENAAKALHGEDVGDGFYGMVFQDSDAAKWIEAAAYSLALYPDEQLSATVDELIDKIAAAQDEDGYLDTYFTIKDREKRWQNLLEGHELYCSGHMMEAACAYYEATGKKKLLDVMEKNAEHIYKHFITEHNEGVPGHPEIELALMKMYRTTGNKKWLLLAEHFINKRGEDPHFYEKEAAKRDWSVWGNNPTEHDYQQSGKPVRAQSDATGHAVRAVYLYTGMAQLSAKCGDNALYDACKRLWESITRRRMYVTGGIGSTVIGEAFSVDYDLPPDTAYAETCASIGLMFFANAMLKNELIGEYADVMETAFYNTVLGGMQLDGKRFFYVNPLETEPGVSGKLYGYKHVLPERPGWYTCACCPPNVVRLLMSLGKYLWSETEDGVYSHIPAGTEAHFDKMDVTVESNYPWDGRVTYHITGKTEEETILGIHIPSWVRPGSVQVRINGKVKDITADVEKGYLILKRVWKNDEVELVFPMKIRKIYANLKVREDAGCVAFMRGPMVYCFEGVDNPGLLQSYHIFEDAKMEEEVCKEGLLEGCVLLKIKARKLETVGDSLYSDIAPVRTLTTLTAVPYYTWGNRGENQMRVWMRGE